MVSFRRPRFRKRGSQLPRVGGGAQEILLKRGRPQPANHFAAAPALHATRARPRARGAQGGEAGAPRAFPKSAKTEVLVARHKLSPWTASPPLLPRRPMLYKGGEKCAGPTRNRGRFQVNTQNVCARAKKPTRARARALARRAQPPGRRCFRARQRARRARGAAACPLGKAGHRRCEGAGGTKGAPS